MTSFARGITESRTFRGFIVMVIVFAGILAGVETDAELMREHGEFLHLLDRIVVGIFIVEIALKILAQGRQPLSYFRDGWNVFDFAIVVFCLLPGTGTFGAVLRLVRVLRLLRLVTALPKLQLLVGALLKSLSAMGYVGLLLSLLFYIYAVAGVHWFGAAAEYFGSLGRALLTLFQVVTLDDWRNVFQRAAEVTHTAKVAAYFVSFIVFGTMIILNLFIGIILNSMSETHEEIAAAEAAVNNPDLARIEQELGRLQDAVRQLRKKQSDL